MSHLCGPCGTIAPMSLFSVFGESKERRIFGMTFGLETSPRNARSMSWCEALTTPSSVESWCKLWSSERIAAGRLIGPANRNLLQLFLCKDPTKMVRFIDVVLNRKNNHNNLINHLQKHHVPGESGYNYKPSVEVTYLYEPPLFCSYNGHVQSVLIVVIFLSVETTTTTPTSTTSTTFLKQKRFQKNTQPDTKKFHFSEKGKKL